MSGLTIEKLKLYAINDHYSYSMFFDLIKRDYNEIYQKYIDIFTITFLRNLFKSLGIQHNNKLYLKLPQHVKVQYKYPKEMSLEEIKKECIKKSISGAEITHKKRRLQKHYIPKNHVDYYIEQGYTILEAERLASEYRRSKSPFSKSFTKYKELFEKDTKDLITELSRNRGLKGLLSMRTGVSLLEQNVYNTLLNHKINCCQQFMLGPYSYDILVKDFNTIIEINGTYWHADPRVYLSQQLIIFPYGTISAQTKWDRDQIKNQYALKNGFKIDILWEIDLLKKGFLIDYLSKFC